MEIPPSLIESCIKGERKAEFQLYKITYSYLMSISLRYTRNEGKAKEALNLGFFKILTNLKKYDNSAPFKPWARKIMVNTLINEYKKEKIHYGNVQYVDEYNEQEKFGSLNNAMHKMNADMIYAFIAKLPPASQQVFNLYYIDGYKHREIAEMLEISEGTSKWHLNAAKERLREMLLKVDQTIDAN